MDSFQLILFDLIGKGTPFSRHRVTVVEGFQLILFDLIGKAPKNRRSHQGSGG